MRQQYKTAAAILAVVCMISEVKAQLNYGTSSGTTGQDRVFVGGLAGNMNSGAFNTFIGKSSGQTSVAGSANTFLGYYSGYANDAGSNNVYLGFQAGRTKGGDQNVFVGTNSGMEYKGSSNVLIGKDVAWKGTGNGNVVMGTSAGRLTSGDGNVFIGLNTASVNTSISKNNVFVGTQAGNYNKNTKENAFFGYEAGERNETGSYNAYFGSYSGANSLTGEYNAFFGYSSGMNNANGKYNTFLGAYADGTANVTNSTAIGVGALVTQSNSIVIGRQIDNVGIGISAPNYQLHLSSPTAAKPGNSVWTIFSDKRLKKDISDYTDGLSLLKQIKPVWFTYNGQAGIKTTKKFVGIIAQDMQKIAPYMIGTFTYQDSLGNKTDYLDYDAGAVTYMLINSVKEQQVIIDQKEEEIQSLSERLSKSDKLQQELLTRLEKLERLTTSSGPNLNNGNGENVAARIEQNAPNGFSQKTSIKYFIPQSVKTAVINIYSANGVKAESYNIQERGEGELTLSATEFKGGIHIYELVTDGQSSGTKKMLVK
ncbi:tail fiber domain-containing protein [Dyadobacter arcticus]|uniref:Ribosomal protein L35AE/L33A n=1 Tax=Dyadobacter arcticus TaxID=1078754 RepID=A0ABX0UG93_9BACT|nr:tail fiber domain-containing protein [Dyadobacter arcticus]NIJ52021.1 ribosomal protein L35AE/L33A [Dyadobacter arcticus]